MHIPMLILRVIHLKQATSTFHPPNPWALAGQLQTALVGSSHDHWKLRLLVLRSQVGMMVVIIVIVMVGMSWLQSSEKPQTVVEILQTLRLEDPLATI